MVKRIKVFEYYDSEVYCKLLKSIEIGMTMNVSVHALVEGSIEYPVCTWFALRGLYSGGGEGINLVAPLLHSGT